MIGRHVVLGIDGEAVGDGLQIARGLGPEVRVDELIHPSAGDDAVICRLGSPGAIVAVVDEGAQAGSEPVGFGEVNEMSAAWPFFDPRLG